MNNWDIDPNLYRSLFSSFRLSLAPRPARVNPSLECTNTVQPEVLSRANKPEDCCEPKCCAS